MNKLFIIGLLIALVAMMTVQAQSLYEEDYEFEYDYDYDEEYDLQATYTVKSGDTLSGIASKYHCTYVLLFSPAILMHCSPCNLS